jgi:hypothetical protein
MSKKPQHSVDPAVASLITGGKQRKKRRGQTQVQREKTEKDKARSRKIYDLPERVIDAVDFVAETEGLSASAVAALFLSDAICRYREKRIALNGPGIKRESPSPKWENAVDIDVILAVLRGSRILETD